MILDNVYKACLGFDFHVSDIDYEFPQKFYIEIKSLKEVEIILTILKYFEFFDYHYVFTEEYYKLHKTIDYSQFSGLENVKGIVIGEKIS